MAASSNPPVKNETREPPTPWYGWPFVALGHLFWIWLLLVLIEWLCPWWIVGEHARSLFWAQIQSLDTHLPGSNDKLLPMVNHYLTYVTPALNIEFQGAFGFLKPYWQGVVFVTLSLLMRVLVLVYCYPLFLLACFLGAFDGLVIRQRRVAFVARESETTHFYSRKALPLLTIALGYVWLALPGVMPVPASVLLLPGAVLIGVLVRVACASYKKYL